MPPNAARRPEAALRVGDRRLRAPPPPHLPRPSRGWIRVSGRQQRWQGRLVSAWCQPRLGKPSGRARPRAPPPLTSFPPLRHRYPAPQTYIGCPPGTLFFFYYTFLATAALSVPSLHELSGTPTQARLISAARHALAATALAPPAVAALLALPSFLHWAIKRMTMRLSDWSAKRQQQLLLRRRQQQERLSQQQPALEQQERRQRQRRAVQGKSSKSSGRVAPLAASVPPPAAAVAATRQRHVRRQLPELPASTSPAAWEEEEQLAAAEQPQALAGIPAERLLKKLHGEKPPSSLPSWPEAAPHPPAIVTATQPAVAVLAPQRQQGPSPQPQEQDWSAPAEERMLEHGMDAVPGIADQPPRAPTPQPAATAIGADTAPSAVLLHLAQQQAAPAATAAPVPCLPTAASTETAAGGGFEDGAPAAALSECVVCMEHQANTALVPCGHLILCSTCAGALAKEAQPLCPLCRCGVASSLRVYA